MTKVDVGGPKLIVQRYGETGSEGKGENNTRGRDSQRVLGVASEHPDVHLQTDEEEEKHKPDSRCKGKDRERVEGEDPIAEVGNATHDGRTKQDTSNDLGDDTGLTQLGEGDGEELGEANDYEDLNDPQRKRIVVIPCTGVGTRNDWTQRLNDGELESGYETFVVRTSTLWLGEYGIGWESSLCVDSPVLEQRA